MEALLNHLNQEWAFTMKLMTVGIDLAKNAFQVHGIDVHGKELVKKQPRRDQMATYFANLPPCSIGKDRTQSNASLLAECTNAALFLSQLATKLPQANWAPIGSPVCLAIAGVPSNPY